MGAFDEEMSITELFAQASETVSPVVEPRDHRTHRKAE